MALIRTPQLTASGKSTLSMRATAPCANCPRSLDLWRGLNIIAAVLALRRRHGSNFGGRPPAEHGQTNIITAASSCGYFYSLARLAPLAVGENQAVRLVQPARAARKPAHAGTGSSPSARTEVRCKIEPCSPGKRQQALSTTTPSIDGQTRRSKGESGQQREGRRAVYVLVYSSSRPLRPCITPKIAKR